MSRLKFNHLSLQVWPFFPFSFFMSNCSLCSIQYSCPELLALTNRFKGKLTGAYPSVQVALQLITLLQSFLKAFLLLSTQLTLLTTWVKMVWLQCINKALGLMDSASLFLTKILTFIIAFKLGVVIKQALLVLFSTMLNAYLNHSIMSIMCFEFVLLLIVKLQA